MTKRFLFKIAILLIIFSLPLIGTTSASLVDTETSLTNTMSASSLDFSLTSPDDFLPDTLTPGDSSTRSANLVKVGSLDFQYNLSAIQTDGDSDLCNALQIETRLNGMVRYSGSLLGLTATEVFNPVNNWEFYLSLNDYNLSLQSKTCNFNLIFNGEQIGGNGFTDQEILPSVINSSTWEATASSDIVLNEILPNPSGLDSAPNPNGEWVELYNKSDTVVSVENWHLTDASSNSVLINGSKTNTGGTDIDGFGFLVVYVGPTSLTLNDAGDTVNLFMGPVDLINLVDSHTYGDTPEAKSIARIPDGWGDWFDPIPTPGGPNKLELELEERVSQDNQAEATEEKTEEPEATPEPESSSEPESSPEPDLILPSPEPATQSSEINLPVVEPSPSPELQPELEPEETIIIQPDDVQD